MIAIFWTALHPMNEEDVANWSPATTITAPTIITATTATTTTTTTATVVYFDQRTGAPHAVHCSK